MVLSLFGCNLNQCFCHKGINRLGNGFACAVTNRYSSLFYTVLANYEESASMHVALVYRGEPEKAQKFLDKQDKFLETKTDKEGADNNG